MNTQILNNHPNLLGVLMKSLKLALSSLVLVVSGLNAMMPSGDLPRRSPGANSPATMRTSSVLSRAGSGILPSGSDRTSTPSPASVRRSPVKSPAELSATELEARLESCRQNLLAVRAALAKAYEILGIEPLKSALRVDTARTSPVKTARSVSFSPDVYGRTATDEEALRDLMKGRMSDAALSVADDEEEFVGVTYSPSPVDRPQTPRYAKPGSVDRKAQDAVADLLQKKQALKSQVTALTEALARARKMEDDAKLAHQRLEFVEADEEALAALLS